MDIKNPDEAEKTLNEIITWAETTESRLDAELMEYVKLLGKDERLVVSKILALVYTLSAHNVARSMGLHQSFLAFLKEFGEEASNVSTDMETKLEKIESELSEEITWLTESVATMLDIHKEEDKQLEKMK